MAIMTVEQLTEFIELTRETGYIDISVDEHGEPGSDDVADTLAAYADIVQAIAERVPDPDAYGDIEERMYQLEDSEYGHCVFCGGHKGYTIAHEPECLYLAARKLRGLE